MSSEVANNPRSRRVGKSYWEPIFEPGLTAAFGTGEWDLKNNHGPHELIFKGSDLQTALSEGRSSKFSGITFDRCDFQGEIARANGGSLVFENCTFKLCDLGLCRWERIKFTNCVFERTTFTQSTFIDCSFRKCKWKDIGISGNETKLIDTYVENPDKFISAAYTNLDKAVLASNNKSILQQRAGLEETKATQSRLIYNSLKTIGDEGAFYKACRTYTVQSAKSQIFGAMNDILSTKTNNWRRVRSFIITPFLFAEIALIMLFGAVNRWGASVSQPLSCLLMSFALFSVTYHYSFDISWHRAIEKSFEISSVAGYTKGAVETCFNGNRFVEWINLSMSLVFYTIFFSTAVAKISRVR